MEDLANGNLTDNSSLAQDSAVLTLFLHLLLYLARLFNFLFFALLFVPVSSQVSTHTVYTRGSFTYHLAQQVLPRVQALA